MDAEVARNVDWSLRQVVIPAAAACVLPPPAPGGLHHLSGATMGTAWSVALMGDARLRLDPIEQTIQATLETLVQQMSTWLPASELCRFNAGARRWQPLSQELMTVLECAAGVAADSNGAFDPTIGPLVDLWGFGPLERPDEPPSRADLALARQRCGWQQIELDVAAGRARQSGGVSIDLSSIAKGFAVDLVAHALDELGIASYLVEIGGELRGRGIKPDLQPWWVRVESPVDPGTGTPLDLVIALASCAVATSGDYRRGFEHDGRWYSHTIDPRTGCPVTHALASVTVIAETCMHADAWSTALMVLGPDDGAALAGRLGLAALLVERTATGLRPVATPAFAQMLAD